MFRRKGTDSQNCTDFRKKKSADVYISWGSRCDALDAFFPCLADIIRMNIYRAETWRVSVDSPKCPVVIICNAFHEVKLWPWDTANWTIPVITYSHIEVSGVKVLKILIKWHKILVWKHAQGYVARKISAKELKPFPLHRKNWLISMQKVTVTTYSCYKQFQSENIFNFFEVLVIYLFIFHMVQKLA